MWVTDIIALVIAGASGLRQLANAVAQAWASWWAKFTSILIFWLQVFTHIMLGAVWAWQAIVDFATALGDWAAYMVLVKIPNTLLQAAQYAEQIGLSTLTAAVSYARGWINYLDNEIKVLVQGAKDEAEAWVNTLRSDLTGAINLLTDVARLVYELLTNPRTMADWVAGEIIGAVFRWAMGNAEALARWAFARLIAATLTGAGVAEQIIVDMFL